jgi:Leucine-rich repeat (LRR) protein
MKTSGVGFAFAVVFKIIICSVFACPHFQDRSETQIAIRANLKRLSSLAHTRQIMLSSSLIRSQYFVEEMGLFVRYPVGPQSSKEMDLAELLKGKESNDIVGIVLPFALLKREELHEFEKLKRLKLLDVGGSNIDNKSVSHLADLEALETLHLYDTEIDRKALDTLTSIKSLKHLSLGGTRVELSAAISFASGNGISSLFAHGLNCGEKSSLNSSSLVILDVAFSDVDRLTLNYAPKLETVIISKNQIPWLKTQLINLDSIGTVFVVDCLSDDERLDSLRAYGMEVFGKSGIVYSGVNKYFDDVNPSHVFSKAR